VEDRAQLLARLPRDEHFVVASVGANRPGEPGLLALGEVLASAAQDRADPVQRITRAAAMPEGLLLHPTPHFVDGLPPSFTT